MIFLKNLTNRILFYILRAFKIYIDINFSVKNKLRKCLAPHFAPEQDFGKIRHFFVTTHFKIEIQPFEQHFMVMMPKYKMI